jgi:hypothetical protein
MESISIKITLASMVLSIMFALVFGILTETTEDDEGSEITKDNPNHIGKFLTYIMVGSLVLSIVFMVTFVISFVVFIFSS